jgi:YgiT-type zinc finger domain-containing protein
MFSIPGFNPSFGPRKNLTFSINGIIQTSNSFLIDMMTQKPNSATIPCRECQAGHMRREFVTYLTWLGDELVTVPDFPAWLCDVCHRREYDLAALNHLSLLLSPSAGKPAARPRPAAPLLRAKDARPSRPE